MIVFDLINRDRGIGIRSFVLLGCISSIANAMVLALINFAAGLASDIERPDQTFYLLSVFLLIVLIYSLAQHRLMLRATVHVENAVNRIRKDLLADIRHCELQTIDRIGRERIFTTINKELDTITGSSQLFVIVGQSGLLMVFTSIYIAWLSFVAFLFILGCVILGASVHLRRNKEIRKQLRDTFQQENDLLLRLNDTLDGFKEVKLSNPRADELMHEFNYYSDEVYKSEVKTRVLFTKDSVLSQVSFFLGLGSVVFLVPLVSGLYPEVVIEVTTATLFLFGPINSFVNGIPALATANAAAKNVLNLEAELSAARVEKSRGTMMREFEEICLEDIHFKHQMTEGERAFEIGPINMNITKGQTIFITGGNGSGKTTFIRVLTGLYQSDSGRIRVDGRHVDDLDAYRNLYSAVFSDFHLFQYMYGLQQEDEAEMQHWLDFLEMSHKVHIRNKKFSTIDLSGGQRKRLALLSCVLENRAIYIFDEWAADQDPYFREKFYREILPELKARGQTVIAITHDDKFFDMADVHYKMADGQLTLVGSKTQKNS